MPINLKLTWKNEKKPEIEVLEDSLILYDISCVDADGEEFEHYDKLAVRRDIFRDSLGHMQELTPYNAAFYCEQNGLFFPSLALTCNIVAAAYENRNNPEMRKLLMQYKNYGGDIGWHAQNTVIDYGAEEIIHYPSAADFNQVTAINTNLRTTRKFAKAILHECSLKDALKDPAHTRYVKQLTRLADPEVLVEMGRLLWQTGKITVPLEQSEWFYTL